MILSENIIQEIKEVGNIPYAKLDEILRTTRSDSCELCKQLELMGYADRATLGRIVAKHLKRTYMDLGKTLFQEKVLAKLPRESALKYIAIPVYQFGPAVTVALADPGDLGVCLVLEKVLGAPVDPVFSFEDEIRAAIKVHYEAPDQVTSLARAINLDSLVQMTEAQLADLKPVVAISESILLLALKERVTDIHIEPKRHECWVRFRIDGGLVSRVRLPVALMRPLAARYKIMANLDIAESRKPQDGRIAFPTPAKSIDIRVSTLPVVHGEKIVMRLLGSLSSNICLNLDRLDMAAHILEPLKRSLLEPNGILLVTGPTGSGKSTTLYAALNCIDSPDTNISTIEDPVEYEVTSINQASVDVKAGRTFQAILRAMLRQDPDVILVGEIRDVETARTAMQAALTGHLVLSSLHTNGALQAINRLIDIGVESYIVAPAVLGVLAQRLVRRLCVGCRKPYRPSLEALSAHFFWSGDVEPPVLYNSEGCAECRGTGFKGRIGIHEYFRVTSSARNLILRGGTYAELKAHALQSGFRDLRHDGFVKAFQGLTTIDEVVKATSTDS